MRISFKPVCASACHAVANSDPATASHFKSPGRFITISTEGLQLARPHSMSGMVVSSLIGAEGSAKIALSALRGGAAAMALLRDRDRPRCIFVGFRAREFINQ